jgi:hypothetical protein
MASQLYATTGRRTRPRYVDIINQQAPMLPALYQQKANQKLEEKSLSLEEANMERNAALQREALDEEKRQAEEAKKQARIANMLGVTGLGVKTGLGIYGAMDASKPTDTAGIIEKATPAAKATDVGNVSEFTGTQAGAAPSFLSMEGAGSPSNWMGALSSGSTWGAGGIGTLASKLLTKKDDSTLKKVGIGAGAGALAGTIFSGADPYQSVLSGILGGLGGGLF